MILINASNRSCFIRKSMIMLLVLMKVKFALCYTLKYFIIRLFYY